VRPAHPRLWISAKFAASCGANVTPELAAFMAHAEVPWGVGAPNGIISEAAWRSKPSWYLVATDDRMIPPPAQRTMAERIGSTVTETPAVTPSTSPIPRPSPA
jgi:hypothetical protein